jgi:hypothetical protein
MVIITISLWVLLLIDPVVYLFIPYWYRSNCSAFVRYLPIVGGWYVLYKYMKARRPG